MDQYLSLLKNPSWDIVLVLMLMAGGFFWGISYGKKSLGFVIVSVYVLFGLWPFVPMNIITDERTAVEIWMFRTGAFILLLLLLILFMLRAFKWFSAKDGAWWEILILSAMGAGFLMSIFLNLAPVSVLQNNTLKLSPFVLQIFASEAYTRWWMILPILAVLFV